MSDYHNECSYPVINWGDVKGCQFARKCWVHPSNVDEEKEYEKGCFPRAYCEHDERWCNAEFGYEDCTICMDHLNE